LFVCGFIIVYAQFEPCLHKEQKNSVDLEVPIDLPRAVNPLCLPWLLPPCKQ
jgi:hypothetical protein